MRHRGRYHICWLTAREREPELHYCPPVDPPAGSSGGFQAQPINEERLREYTLLLRSGEAVLCSKGVERPRDLPTRDHQR